MEARVERRLRQRGRADGISIDEDDEARRSALDAKPADLVDVAGGAGRGETAEEKERKKRARIEAAGVMVIALPGPVTERLRGRA